MAQLSHPNLGQFVRTIPSKAQKCLWGPSRHMWSQCSPSSPLLNPAAFPSLPSPQGLMPRELCLISFLYSNLHLRVCFLGNRIATLPPCHLLLEYLRLRECFSHLFLSCLPSAAPPVMCSCLSPLTLLLAISWNC